MKTSCVTAFKSILLPYTNACPRNWFSSFVFLLCYHILKSSVGVDVVDHMMKMMIDHLLVSNCLTEYYLFLPYQVNEPVCKISNENCLTLAVFLTWLPFLCCLKNAYEP